MIPITPGDSCAPTAYRLHIELGARTVRCTLVHVECDREINTLYLFAFLLAFASSDWSNSRLIMLAMALGLYGFMMSSDFGSSRGEDAHAP